MTPTKIHETIFSKKNTIKNRDAMSITMAIALRALAMAAPVIPIFISGYSNNESKVGLLTSLMIFYAFFIRAGFEHTLIEIRNFKIFPKLFFRSLTIRTVVVLPLIALYAGNLNIKFGLLEGISFFLFSLMSGLSSHFLPAGKRVMATLFAAQFPIWIGSILFFIGWDTMAFLIGICLGSLAGISFNIYSLIKINLNSKEEESADSTQVFAAEKQLRVRVIYHTVLSAFNWVVPLEVSSEIKESWFPLVVRVLNILFLPIIIFNSVLIDKISKFKNSTLPILKNITLFNLIFSILVSSIGIFLFWLMPTDRFLISSDLLAATWLAMLLLALSGPFVSFLTVNGHINYLLKITVVISAVLVGCFLGSFLSAFESWFVFNVSFSIAVTLFTVLKVRESIEAN